MTAKTRPKSRILAAIHSTARDLRSAGFIDKRRMREYDALCLAPVRPYSSRKSALSLASVDERSRPSREPTGELSPVRTCSKLTREATYKMLSKSGNPELRSLNAVFKATGLRIAVRPIEKRAA